MTDFWSVMERRGPGQVVVDGTPIGAGSRVRLRPKAQADAFDLVLDGRVAVVEGIEQDDEGAFHLAVTLEDDPGRDLGEARLPGHRFFFSAGEVEPLAGEAPVRVLVAGIGNVFLGDDGFGVEVARRLAARPVTPGVDVVDFGIRGMDLAFALQRDYEYVIFVDAAPRGEPPGTLTVLEPHLPEAGTAPVETHGMDPVRVLALARELGRIPERVRVVCCEPAGVMAGTPDEDVVAELSGPVLAAVEQAERLVLDMIAESARGASRDQDIDRGDMA